MYQGLYRVWGPQLSKPIVRKIVFGLFRATMGYHVLLDASAFAALDCGFGG